MAKIATDAILAKFKSGEWKCCGNLGPNFYRTCTFSDFPSPDASFADEKNKFLVSFEFKPPTESKRGILTGLGQAIAYLNRSSISYLIAPNVLEGFAIEDYLKGIFSNHLKDKVSVGLITYDVNDASNVSLIVNISKNSTKPIRLRNERENRYWAKHQDLPLPLFFLILHFYYRKRVGDIIGDAYAECWKKHMARYENGEDFKPLPVIDLNGNTIKTMNGNDNMMYNKGIFDKLKRECLCKHDIELGLRSAIATERPEEAEGHWDNNYKKVRRYLLAFFKQINIIDSNNEITETGLRLHQIGLVYGQDSKLFKDYFTKEILTTGCHFDLIIDFDKMYREKPTDMKITDFLEKMEDAYEEKGFIKRNPNRKSNKNNNKPFLQHERTLWRYLGLVDESYNVNWKKIIEVCSLPEL